MASIRKVGKRWQAQVARAGVRKSKLFDSKTDAKDWAARQEYLILNGEGEHGPGTLSDLFDRYAREVSPRKRGARWEQIRLEKLSRDRLAKVSVRDVRAGDFAEWRDRRLSEVSASSVHRELCLLSAVCSVAWKEWGLLSSNPVSDVRKPSKPPPRDRRVSDAEIDLLVKFAGSDLSRSTARAIHAFRFAVETGMRAGEIIGLRSEHIEGRVAFLPMTKNGTSRRVPLSSKALSLLEDLPENDPLFGLKSAQLDTLFRRTRDRASIDGLTFHDARHEATTRLSKKLDPLSLARMLGHKNLSQTMAYFNETAEELAARLD